MKLATIIKSHTSEYLILEYCKHYSKYTGEIFLKITSEGEDSKEIKNIFKLFNTYFPTCHIIYELNTRYRIEGESEFYSTVVNNISKDEWIIIADMDEFIEVEKIPQEVLDNEEMIPGILIDRLASKDQTFDPNKSIFENYPDQYFFYNWKRTSFPTKEVLVRGRSKKVEVGHHIWDPAPYIKRKWCQINHFKWREDSKYFLLRSRNNHLSKMKEAYDLDLHSSLEILDMKNLYEKAQKYRVRNEIFLNPEHKEGWYLPISIKFF